MVRKVTYFMVAILIVTTTFSEENEQVDRTDFDTYLWLERKGMFDPKVPNSQVHDLLSKGINHEDPKIVHCAISAIVWYCSSTRWLRVHGKQHPTDRKLGEIPGLYDLLIGLWEEGYEEAGGIVPRATYSASWEEQWDLETACLAPDPVWTSLSMPMAYMFPGDDKVYEIIWKDLPQISPGSLLVGLFEGKFNNPKDEQLRIDILTNPETELYWSSIAARSLGDFRTVRSLDTLVQVLENDNMTYGAPKFVIVEAMMKHEADAAPYLDLMRTALEEGTPLSSVDRDLKTVLQERLVHFEEKYVEEAELPSR